MTEMVDSQFNMMIIALILGVNMGLTYDVIRCTRRIFIHNIFFVSLEDFIYWLIWTITLLDEISEYNDGELRAYIFIFIIIGFAIYKATFGWLIMKIADCIIGQCKKHLKKIKKNLKKTRKNSII